MTKLVVLTGASSGIGRATALELASRACDLILTSRREALLSAVAADCGTQATYHVGDVGDCASCEQLADHVRSRAANREIVLVNAAGVAEFGGFTEMSLESMQGQIHTNLLGPMYLAHFLLPEMLKVGEGQIVNVLSVAADHVFPGAAAYGASKAGLRMMSKVWAAEYRAKGIRVTSVLPGAVDTPIWGESSPPREQMLPAEAVAQTIADVIFAAKDRSFDEILLMPPRGIL